MEDEFINNTETLLATVVRLFAIDGCAKEVAVLANSKSYVEQTDCGGWNSDIYGYTINLKVNLNLYTQIESVRNEIEENIKTKLNSIVVDNWHYYEKILISPELSKDPDWRVKANNWLKGDTISNQGRVRSDNIASKSCDGLLFRSQPEILFYKAMKSFGVSFAPLPVFIKGGNTYQRIEPDFFIIKEGIMMVVEIDGDTVHLETPVEAHNRTTMLLHEGVNFERLKASECDSEEKALNSAKKISNIIDKIKNNK